MRRTGRLGARRHRWASAILVVALLIGSLGSLRASSCRRADSAAETGTAVASVAQILTAAHQHGDGSPDAAYATPAMSCGGAVALPVPLARRAASLERLDAAVAWRLVLPSLQDLPPPLRPPRLS